VGFLEDTAETQSVIVIMGDQIVFPPEPGDMDFYQRLEGLARRGDRAQFRMKRLPWPTRPVFAMDFLDAKGSEASAEKRQE
jgi:hypothetical protein